jgi:hypothetical protein
VSSALLPLCLLSSLLMGQAPDARSQRLAEAGRVWGRLKWVHPALADERIDWDQALLGALPELAQAQTEDARKAALQKLLAPLGDPALRIGPRVPPTYVKADPGLPPVAWLPGELALLQVHRAVGAWDPAFTEALSAAEQALGKAKGLVVDLRPGSEASDDPADFVDRLISRLLTRPLTLPAPRFLFNYSFRPQVGSSSTGYYTAWMVQSARQLVPDARARPLPVAFVVNEWTSIPGSVLAMQRAGLAWLVAEGHPHAGWVTPTDSMDLDGGLQVTYAAGDLIFADGPAGFGPDRTVAASLLVGPESPGVKAAAALLGTGGKPGAKVPRKPLAPQPRWAPDLAYAGTTFPDLPLRRLAVIRLWAVMDAFFPYLDLMDQPWDAALPEFLSRMESVKDGREYALAIAEMAARLQDNHVLVRGPEILKFYGEASLPVRLTMVGGKAVVSHVLDEKAAAGVHRWDEVLELDGEPIPEAIARISLRVASANPWTRDRNVVTRGLLGRGGDGSEAILSVRTGTGSARTVRLPRTNAYFAMKVPERKGEIIRLLEPDIGYADLDRLEIAQVDELFEKVRDTTALILDMRGYPRRTAWSIAPRLNVKASATGPLWSPRLQYGGPGEMDAPRMTWAQRVPQGDGKPLYRGKVVMLMDERTQSQAEHSGLFFEAACDITYVGSPTAGSNGDVTTVVLPGDLTVRFTGQAVRHADGRQLQRVGLQPHVPVSPTLEGLMAGRDEVLERAIQFIRAGR